MSRTVLLLMVALGGCDWTFDEEAPGIPLVGDPPNMGNFPRFNRAPARGHWTVQGKDNAYWMAITEVPRNLRVLRLGEPPKNPTFPTESVFEIPEGVQLSVYWRAFLYTYTDPAAKCVMGMCTGKPTTISFWAAGEAPPGQTFEFPPGPAWFLVTGAEQMFLYWPRRDPAAKQFELWYRDGTPKRTFALPLDAKGNAPPQGNLFVSGSNPKSVLLVMRTADDHVLVYNSAKPADPPRDIGKLPKTAYNLNRPKVPGDDRSSVNAMITIGEDGLRWVPLDGSAPTVLDASPCRTEVFTWRYVEQEGTKGYWFFYLVGDELRSVPFDAHREPVVLIKGSFERLLGWAPDGRIVYSRDPSKRYIYGAGDAWLQRGKSLADGGVAGVEAWTGRDDWRFMERGLDWSFSRDGKRIRWLEHAAQTSGTGDLLSRSLPSSGMAAADEEPLRLSRNAWDFEELMDKRVLTLTNRAFAGTHNRVIVIDEQAREARWVATAVKAYGHYPGARDDLDLVVDVYAGPDTIDILRVPVPAKAPEPGGDAGTD